VKLLAVDDNSTMRPIIKNNLGPLGHKDVPKAEYSLEVCHILRDNPHADVLITDSNIPKMNGLKLVQKVRAEEKYVDMPIIMVATKCGKTEAIAALSSGVNNYIVKPSTLQVLKEKFEDVAS